VVVSSVGYRYPAVLAKMAATVDVISGGRLEFGIGAGYLETEYKMYGIPFPPARVRLAQMEEAIQICKLLWTRQRSDFVGQHYTLTDAVCEPKPMQRPHPPIWVGGMGEKKTLRIVAEHADGWNAFPLPVPQLQQKLDILRAHCEAVGRDYDAIAKQLGLRVIVREEPAELEAELERFAQELAVPPGRARQMTIADTPQAIATYLTPYVELGFEMFLLMERTPLDHETLRLFMQSVVPRLREARGAN
jgi:alkanesulfonate monooxygenase SsuD/methylene tetrahydromethanopterin reductase-like flavin-dependent oxidoreductase (luciferase family)